MRILFCAAALLLLFPCFLAAQEPARRAAVIDPAQADADFAFQGEYAGWQWEPWRGWIYRGLQVVALGNGQFEAALLDGGLPGNGFVHGYGRTKLSGRLEEGAVQLRGPSLAVAVNGTEAVVRGESGREVGRLTKVVRTSPTLGAAPPPGASVLFAEGHVENLSYGAKLADDGTLLAGALTKMPVEAFYMHLEFRTPYMPAARGQGRGNSGVYIQQRYEVQILDSFGLEGLENECGGLYKQARPAVNMSLPPLTWQTYDIWFTPPRFAADGETKLAHALLTVLHNGVPIHSWRPVPAKTGGGKPEGPEPFPINLQDHGNPVTFRNVWLVAGDGHAFAPPECPPRRVRLLRGRR